MKTKKDQALDFLQETHGDKKMEEIVAQDDQVKEVAAEFIIRDTATSNKKPKTLKAFENKIKQKTKEAGILLPEQQKELLTKIKKTQLFAKLTNDTITDKQILDVYEEAMSAEKITVVDKEPFYQPDHNTRIASADRIAKFKGIDTKSDDTQATNNNFQVNLINPHDFE